MPFREKTAWILSIALVVGGGACFGVVVDLSNELDRLAELGCDSLG